MVCLVTPHFPHTLPGQPVISSCKGSATHWLPLVCRSAEHISCVAEIQKRSGSMLSMALPLAMQALLPMLRQNLKALPLPLEDLAYLANGRAELLQGEVHLHLPLRHRLAYLVFLRVVERQPRSYFRSRLPANFPERGSSSSRSLMTKCSLLSQLQSITSKPHGKPPRLRWECPQF